jgi:hypothetical protein
MNASTRTSRSLPDISGSSAQWRMIGIACFMQLLSNAPHCRNADANGNATSATSASSLCWQMTFKHSPTKSPSSSQSSSEFLEMWQTTISGTKDGAIGPGGRGR